jgi:hypothetical protein
MVQGCLHGGGSVADVIMRNVRFAGAVVAGNAWAALHEDASPEQVRALSSIHARTSSAR